MNNAVLSLEEALKHKTFIVKSYQRGYRWTQTQVDALLQDIADFAKNGKEHESYFLQPVIVKSLKQEDDSESWELIDGQQRLTTIFLMDAVLCRALNRNSALSFKLRYENRETSGEFLHRLALEPDWAESAEGQKEADANPDFHYMAWACRNIAEFFRRNVPETSLYETFSRRVRVLWYDVTGEEGSAEQRFARLNMGRIPLTGAELCRAQLLSASDEKNAFSPVEHDRRTTLLGREWDELERSLQDPEFRAFLGGDDTSDGAPHMDFLLDLYTGRTPKETDELFSFHIINHRLKEKSSEAILHELNLHHAYLRFWYEDDEYYNILGYLNNYHKLSHRNDTEGKNVLSELLEQAKTKPKSSLSAWASARIRRSISPDETFPTLETLHYPDDNRTLLRLLLLFNVEYSRRRSRRFPFRAYGKARWSLEHIQAQNVEALHTKAQWRTWAEDHQKQLSALRFSALPESTTMTRETFEDGRNSCTHACRAFLNLEEPNRKDFEKLSLIVFDFMNGIGASDRGDIHSLFNLALLDRNDNSSLNNSLFIVKRMKILKKIKEGKTVLPGTEAVFLRYFTEEEESLPFGSEKDRTGYEANLRDVLGVFWPEHEGGTE